MIELKHNFNVSKSLRENTITEDQALVIRNNLIDYLKDENHSLKYLGTKSPINNKNLERLCDYFPDIFDMQEFQQISNDHIISCYASIIKKLKGKNKRDKVAVADLGALKALVEYYDSTPNKEVLKDVIADVKYQILGEDTPQIQQIELIPNPSKIRLDDARN